jgi:hypothetical protein
VAAVTATPQSLDQRILALRESEREQAAIRLARDNEPSFHPVGVDGYRFVLPAYGVTIEAEHLRRERSQLRAEVLVRAEIQGAQTVDGVLSVDDVNLSSAPKRGGFAKDLEALAKTGKTINWRRLIDEFALRVRAAEREGDPAVYLHELPKPTPERTLTVHGFPLLERNPMIVFGDGGTTKSYLALWFAGELAKQGRKVGVFDWELAGADHRLRLGLLFGEGSMPAVTYLRCDRPLVMEVDRIRRTIRERGLTFVILDSIAFACDGKPEDAEVAGRYFRALRSFGEIGSLHLAHVTKALDNADRKPFGSTSWHNGARSTWFVKLSEQAPGDTGAEVALYSRKANFGAKGGTHGFRFTFELERTLVERTDLRDVPDDLAAAMSLSERLTQALRSGPVGREGLLRAWEAEGVSRETGRRTINRAKQSGKLVEIGDRLSLLREGHS